MKLGLSCSNLIFVFSFFSGFRECSKTAEVICVLLLPKLGIFFCFSLSLVNADVGSYKTKCTNPWCVEAKDKTNPKNFFFVGRFGCFRIQTKGFNVSLGDVRRCYRERLSAFKASENHTHTPVCVAFLNLF